MQTEPPVAAFESGQRGTQARLNLIRVCPWRAWQVLASLEGRSLLLPKCSGQRVQEEMFERFSRTPELEDTLGDALQRWREQVREHRHDQGLGL